MAPKKKVDYLWYTSCKGWLRAEWDMIAAFFKWIYVLFCRAQEPFYEKKRIRGLKNNGKKYDLVIISKNPEVETEIPDEKAYQARLAMEQRKADFLATKIEYPIFYKAKYIAYGLAVGWALLLLTVTAIRIRMNDSSFKTFFTNWMWIFNLVFFVIDVIGYWDPRGYIHFYLIYLVWWPFFGNVAIVFWIVMIILYIHPQLVTDEAEKWGWGLVINMERLVHVLPYVFCIFWLPLRGPDVINVLKSFQWITGRKWLFIVYLLMMYVFAHVPFITYIGVYDFHQIYHIQIPDWMGIIMAEIIFLLHVALPICILSPMMNGYMGDIYKPVTLLHTNNVYEVQRQEVNDKTPNMIVSVVQV